MRFDRVILSTVLLTAVTLTFVSCGRYGESCGPDKHCETGLSLICHEQHKNCTCANGRFEQNLQSKFDYKMEWDRGLNRCVGVEGSLCVGTTRYPVLNGVDCFPSLTCIQIPEQPNGIGTCKMIPKTSSHDSNCDENNYCDASAGLICGETKKCVCGAGNFNHELSFSLTWDEERRSCMATPSSLCIGTQLNPLVGGEKRVECERGICTQLEGKPPGVGICQTSDPDPSSTTLKPEETTAGAMSNSLTFQTLIFVAIISIASQLIPCNQS